MSASCTVNVVLQACVCYVHCECCVIGLSAMFTVNFLLQALTELDYCFSKAVRHLTAPLL